VQYKEQSVEYDAWHVPLVCASSAKLRFVTNVPSSGFTFAEVQV